MTWQSTAIELVIIDCYLDYWNNLLDKLKQFLCTYVKPQIPSEGSLWKIRELPHG